MTNFVYDRIFRLVVGLEAGFGSRSSGARDFRAAEEDREAQTPNWSLF